MLHMSVCVVTKLHICSMYSQLVAVNNGRSIVFLPHVNFERHVSKMYVISIGRLYKEPCFMYFIYNMSIYDIQKLKLV